jgi:hypothetical protein
MTITEILAILAMTAWAVYRQTRAARLGLDASRFKLAIIYAVVGVAVGGFDPPAGTLGWAMIGLGLALSLVVGLVRGRRTRIWIDDAGAVWSRGTALTVGLFLGLIATKFALGTAAYILGIDDGAGFGEVLVMIAIMIAVQAEIVHRRALVVVSSARSTQPVGLPA